MRVLVAYATKHGSTRGIAEKIAETLKGEDLEVTLAEAGRAGQAGPLEGFDAFVIGSAAYMGQWLKEATQLVRDNTGTLASRPTWLFSSGPIGTDLVDAKGRDVLEASRPIQFKEFAELLRPRDEAVFFGAYDPDQPAIGLAERLATIFVRAAVVKQGIPSGDFRDWPRIADWARSIARDLKGTPTRLSERREDRATRFASQGLV
jgi:menaquinone-dependent protoporphyrinogen oxidase